MAHIAMSFTVWFTVFNIKNGSSWGTEHRYIQFGVIHSTQYAKIGENTDRTFSKVLDLYLNSLLYLRNSPALKPLPLSKSNPPPNEIWNDHVNRSEANRSIKYIKNKETPRGLFLFKFYFFIRTGLMS